jgi:hypothetical protein
MQLNYNYDKKEGLLTDAQWQELEYNFYIAGIKIKIERIFRGFIIFFEKVNPDLLNIPKNAFTQLDPNTLPEKYAEIYFSNTNETIYVASDNIDMTGIFDRINNYLMKFRNKDD